MTEHARKMLMARYIPRGYGLAKSYRFMMTLANKKTETPVFFRIVSGEGTSSDWFLRGLCKMPRAPQELVWVNLAGGYCRDNPDKVRILAVEETEHETDLDWKGTWIDQPQSDAGWLAPNGTFYGCLSMAHDTYARYILHREVRELEAARWGRVYGKHGEPKWVICGYDSITQPQIDWLFDHGHTDFERYDLREV